MLNRTFINNIKDYYKDNSEVTIKTIVVDSNELMIIYVESLIDTYKIEKFIVPTISRLLSNSKSVTNHNLFASAVLDKNKFNEIDKVIYSGSIVVYVYKTKQLYSFESPALPSRNPTPSVNAITTLGAQDCFVENIKTNQALVHYRYKNNDLKSFEFEIGEDTKTKAVIFYIDSKSNKNLIEDIKSKVKDLNMKDGINVSRIQKQLSTPERETLFPLMEYTYKPDFVIDSLLKGKFVMFVDGIPVASIGPANIYTFMGFHYASQETYVTGLFEMGLSYISMFIAIFLSGFICAIVEYFPEYIPYSLIANIYTTRKGVFLTFSFEMILVELIFQVLRLAGTRLPNHISATIIVIGSIIVSEIGVAGGMFGPYVLLISAIVMICSFAISNNSSFNIAVNICRIVIMITSAIWGIFGFTIASLFVLIYISSLSSFSTPFLYPFAPFNFKKLKQGGKIHE